MEPLDLSARPPRSCYAELDGLMLMPRTIDKLRAQLPGGNPGGYWINGKIKGISGFMLEQLGISETDILQAVKDAKSDDDVALWLRERVDASLYPQLNQTLRCIRPRHAEDPEYFGQVYAEVLKAYPELERIVDIVDADDRRMFPEPSLG